MFFFFIIFVIFVLIILLSYILWFFFERPKIVEMEEIEEYLDTFEQEEE